MATIDVERIKEQHSCKDIISRDLGEPVKISGGAWQWYCCFHDDRSGGSPSLTAWDDGWKCFSGACDSNGDVIGWVMKRQMVDFRRACEILTDGRIDSYTTDTPRQEKSKPPMQKPASDRWQESAKQFIAESQDALWSEAGVSARAYLAKRGLAEETMCIWGLGYNPKERWDNNLDAWPEAKDGNRKAVWLPRAIVIPHYQKGLDIVWSVKFRLATVDPDAQKYSNIPGGQCDLYGVDLLQHHTKAVMCEGEFDTMLLHQEIGDLVDVFTFGSASVRDVTIWKPHLRLNKRLYVVMDSDGAGETSAQKWLKATERAIRILPPEPHKDITDAHLAGADLRAWAIETMGLKNLDNTSMDTEPDYITMAFPPDSKVPVIGGKWHRNEADEIVATYTKSELEMCMEMMR